MLQEYTSKMPDKRMFIPSVETVARSLEPAVGATALAVILYLAPSLASV